MQKRMSVSALTSENFDVAKTIGIAVANNRVHLMTCKLPANIAEKMQAAIPAWDIPAEGPRTYLKGVQLKDGLLIVEMEGMLTTPVKDVIDVVATSLAKKEMFTGFFPASGGKRSSQCYYGPASDMLRNVAAGIEHVRFMDNDKSLLFTRRENSGLLYKMPIGKIDQPWIPAAAITHAFDQDIKFLGRVQNNKVDVVFRDDSAHRVKVEGRQVTSIKKSSLLEQGAAAVFGIVKIAGNEFLAALQGRELVLVMASK